MKTSKPRVRIKSTPTRLIFAALAIFAIALCSSCSLVRTITNESQYVQKGDTSVIIQTKTIEKYDGSKRF